MNAKITETSKIVAHLQGFNPGSFNYSKTLKDGSLVFKHDGVLTRYHKGYGCWAQIRVTKYGKLYATVMNLKNEISHTHIHNYSVFDKEDTSEANKKSSEHYTTCLADKDSIVLVRFKNGKTVGFKYSCEEVVYEPGYSCSTRYEYYKFVAQGFDGYLLSYKKGGFIQGFNGTDSQIMDMKVLKTGVTRGEVSTLCAQMDAVEYKEKKITYPTKCVIFNDNRGGIGVLLDETVCNIEVKSRRSRNYDYKTQKETMSAKLVLHSFKDYYEAVAAINQYYTKGFTKIKTKDVRYKPSNMLMYGVPNEELVDRLQRFTAECGMYCRIMHSEFRPYANLMPAA